MTAQELLRYRSRLEIRVLGPDDVLDLDDVVSAWSPPVDAFFA